MRYDLYSLSLFISVANTGSIAQAAERHNIAPSAVSRRMAELETLFGAPLLYRQQRGVSLTPAGQELRRHARELQIQVARMENAMSDYAHGVKGTVRLAANTSSITQFLPEDLASFVEAYPEIRIKLVELFSTEVLEAVRSGDADIGICSGLTETGDLNTVLYRRDTLVLALPDGHRFAERDTVGLDDLLEEDIVSLQEGSSIQAYIEQRAEEIERPLRTRVQVMSFDGVRRMVQAGLGVAILPHGAVAQFLGQDGLAMVSISEPWAERTLWIVARRGEEMPRPAAMLMSFLTGER